ncbi:MAG: hypothetical protein LBB79_07870 [Prevotellaceae bacterium]|nr:hypothetical protein [Prevotellaceae bacterium]
MKLEKSFPHVLKKGSVHSLRSAACGVSLRCDIAQKAIFSQPQFSRRNAPKTVRDIPNVWAVREPHIRRPYAAAGFRYASWLRQ